MALTTHPTRHTTRHLPWRQLLAASLTALLWISACDKNEPVAPGAPVFGTSVFVEIVDSVFFGDPYKWAHLTWQGTVNDRAATEFIYVFTAQPDSFISCGDLWSPATSRADRAMARVTTDTELWVPTEFSPQQGSLANILDQMFIVAASDGKGHFDPKPACVPLDAVEYWPAPTVHIATYINGVARPCGSAERDTIPMFQPFGFSYHGTSLFGAVTQYWWEFRTGPDQPGEAEWSDDPGDTLHTLANTGAVAFPAGVHRVFVKCADIQGVESLQTPCEVRVGLDPDTRFTGVENSYQVGGQDFTRMIDFNDAVPDTVPMGSWVDVQYEGWDDPRDGKICAEPSVDPDRCVNFQMMYERNSARILGAHAFSGWLPRAAGHDTDASSNADHNSANVASLEYGFMVRTVDESGSVDGTPPTVEIVGNYDPTLDSLAMSDHFGKRIDVSGTTVDTLEWNFWKGVGYPYTAILDTLDAFGTLEYFKTFEWRLQAWGHDHPVDPDGSGVKAWQFFVEDDTGTRWPLGSAGVWRDGMQINQFDDVFQVTFRYPSPITDPTGGGDPNGDTVFDNLPGYFNRDLTIVGFKGRDTSAMGEEFNQYVYLAEVPPGQAASPDPPVKVLINSYPHSSLGRWTEERTWTFHFRMVR